MEQDIYQQEVERLTQNPKEIYFAWSNGRPLFRMIGDLLDSDGIEDVDSGCLTMIRKSPEFGAFINRKYDKVLTEEIREDSLLPTNGEDIEPKHLQRFAYWQRRIDALNQQ